MMLCPHFASKVFTFDFELIDPTAYKGSSPYDGVSYPGTQTVTAADTAVETKGIVAWLQQNAAAPQADSTY